MFVVSIQANVSSTIRTKVVELFTSNGCERERGDSTCFITGQRDEFFVATRYRYRKVKALFNKSYSKSKHIPLGSAYSIHE